MKEKSPKKLNALIIRPASLPADTKALIQVATPIEFIKKRPGKGNRDFTYVEGGYVIARLNQIFSPVGWDFEVIEHIIETKEVVVKGKLTIKDHKNGFEIAKTQYGTHPRYAEVPLGDALKAASTDCLKKCASLLGIALDVYWKQLDEERLVGKTKNDEAISGSVVSSQPTKPATIKKSDLTRFSLNKIKEENDPTILTKYREKLLTSGLYSEAQKKMLCGAIDAKIKQYGK